MLARRQQYPLVPFLCLAAGAVIAAGACLSVPHDHRVDQAPASQPQRDNAAIFLEVWTLVRDNFYDPSFNGVDWSSVRDELLPSARGARDSGELSRIINDALSRLHASHTRYFTPLDREYFEILDIFNPPPDGVPADLSKAIPAGPVSYVGVGLIAQQIGDRIFVADVYDTGPADAAGIHIGDELLGVEDAPWSDIAAFKDREGVPTRIRLRREPDGPVRTVIVTPAQIQPHTLFRAAMERSARLIQHEGKSVAYIHVRSYASAAYQELVVELLRTRLSVADALVLDLRGPWGGANPEYLAFFSPIIPNFESRTRDGEWTGMMFAWHRPVALIIDSSAKSGKEVVAHAFRKHARGPLVGTTTGGAVLAGRPFYLSDGSILYLAVADVRFEGVRLEGVGVEPTVRVERRLPFADGRDEQLDAAIGAVLREGTDPR